MYIYIMNRTQIYLTDAEEAALRERSKKTGRSKSDLIREAIDQKFLGANDDAALLKVLRDTAGSWKGRRDSGATYVDKVRSGRLSRLYGEKSK